MAKVVIANTDSPKDSRTPINNMMTELYTGANTVAATEKTTPVDADKFPIQNSADSNLLYWYSWANLKATIEASSTLINIGDIKMIAGRTAKTGWLLCQGTAVSRSTYAALFAELVPTIGTFAVSIATPAVVTLNTHGFNTGDAVYLTTTGALPTGLTANTIYYVVYTDANTFSLATTLANALAGTKIATSGTQSGTHTLKFCPYGLGDGSTTFNVPNIKGKSVFGLDTSDNNFKNLNVPLDYKGEKTHLLTGAESGEKGHNHTQNAHNHGTYGTPAVLAAGSVYAWFDNAGSRTTVSESVTATNNAVAASDASSAHNNLPPHIVLNFVIKT